MALVVIIGFFVYLYERYLVTSVGVQFSGSMPPADYYGIAGFFSALVGIVVLGADFLRKMVVLPAPEKVTALIGWSLVVAGLIVITVTALEECSECSFNANDSFLTLWGGVIACLAGLTVVASAVLASQFRPARHSRLARWALAAVVVALVVATLWTGSSAYSAYVNNTTVVFPFTL